MKKMLYTNNPIVIIICTLLIFLLFSCSKSEPTLYKIVEKGKYGFIDSLGNVIIAPQYNYASDFNDDLTLVIKDSLYGYINKKGKEIVSVTNSIFDFASEIRLAQDNSGRNLAEEDRYANLADEYRSFLENKPDTIFDFDKFYQIDNMNFSDGLALYVNHDGLYVFKLN